MTYNIDYESDMYFISIFIFQWRRFNFFDKEVVKYPDSTEVFAKLKVKTQLN